MAFGVEPLAVEGGDAAGLLAAMLQRVQPQRHQARGLGNVEHPEHPALEAGTVIGRVPREAGPDHGLRVRDQRDSSVPG